MHVQKYPNMQKKVPCFYSGKLFRMQCWDFKKGWFINISVNFWLNSFVLFESHCIFKRSCHFQVYAPRIPARTDNGSVGNGRGWNGSTTLAESRGLWVSSLLGQVGHDHKMHPLSARATLERYIPQVSAEDEKSRRAASWRTSNSQWMHGWVAITPGTPPPGQLRACKWTQSTRRCRAKPVAYKTGFHFGEGIKCN